MELLKSKKTMWEQIYRTMEKREERKGRTVTLTLNPNVTQVMVVDGLATGRENELYGMSADIGGFGIDVSRILSGCGYSTMCAGFRFSTDKKTLEQFMQMLKIPYVFADADGKMRSIVRILNKNGQPVTELKECGWKVSSGACSDLGKKRKKVLDGLKPEDVLAVGGSAAKGVRDDVYRAWIAGAKEKGARSVLCAEGVLLKEGLKELPYAVVLSEAALDDIAGRPQKCESDRISEAYRMIESGISLVCIYNQDYELILVDKNRVSRGKVAVKDAVCDCGAIPSLAAGICMAMSSGREEEALKYVQAVMNGTLQKQGNGMCTSADFEKYFSE